MKISRAHFTCVLFVNAVPRMCGFCVTLILREMVMEQAMQIVCPHSCWWLSSSPPFLVNGFWPVGSFPSLFLPSACSSPLPFS